MAADHCVEQCGNYNAPVYTCEVSTGAYLRGVNFGFVMPGVSPCGLPT
jgi:hypothetical protein